MSERQNYVNNDGSVKKHNFICDGIMFYFQFFFENVLIFIKFASFVHVVIYYLLFIALEI